MASLHYESVYAPVRSKTAKLSHSNTKQCRGAQSEDQASYMSMLVNVLYGYDVH